jgi:uncharacterized small protein (DUF1192 family)
VSFYKPDSDAERVKALEAEVLRLKAELEDWKDGAAIEAQRADEMQAKLRVADGLLRRLAEWDHMQSAGDGPYWLNEIAKALDRLKE